MKKASKILRGAALVPLALVLLAACEEPIGLGNFLIRSPADDIRYTFLIPAFTASPAAADSIHFEWEPAPGGDAYTIVFKRTDTKEQMYGFVGDLASPTFSIPVDRPAVVDAPHTPGNEEDPRKVRVVQYELGLDELDGLLANAGLPTGIELYFVWSVVARQGSEEALSIERQRMILTRATS